ncbi:PTS sugar transporter subunit IIA [Vibrio sp. CB1-14]|uniref:PTS sugar transporter subunit IIA n=1 Tax=Vibrio chaetopteri TaxID=3016528 RepID=A0AAU8BIN2_9VIBR
MDISSVLNVNNIKLNMVAKNKIDAIEELTDLLVQNGSVIDKDEFLRDILLREELGPTGFDNYIALPHGESSAVHHTALAIGRTQHDITWDAEFGVDVRCIILYAIRLDEQDATSLRLLAHVSSTLAFEDITEQLLKENDPRHIVAIFNTQVEFNH